MSQTPRNANGQVMDGCVQKGESCLHSLAENGSSVETDAKWEEGISDTWAYGTVGQEEPVSCQHPELLGGEGRGR